MIQDHHYQLDQHQREEKVKDDLAIVHRVTRDVGYKPMPELGKGPVLPGVDVQIR